MNRITECLAQCKTDAKKALVGYVVCGDPVPAATPVAMQAMVDSGVDIIELGVPFSDPMADGSTIQLGHERALASGTSLRDTLAQVAKFRETNSHTPVVLMGYANPMERFGYAEFAKAASVAGVDGILTVDLPFEEAEAFNRELKAVDIENIFLIAPTSTDKRIESISELASGFLYYVSLKGVTGAATLDIDSVTAKMNIIRQKSDLPVCVGFGIKDAASAAAVAKTADGVVIGSVLVDKMSQFSGTQLNELRDSLVSVITPIRQALDKS